MKNALAALAFLFSSTVAAQPYVAAGLAWTNSGDSRLFLLPGFGYSFSRHLAIEGAYFNPGEVSSTDTVTASIPNVSTSKTVTTQRVSGAKLSLIGTVPVVETLSLLGTLSLYRLRGEQRETDTLDTSERRAVTQAERSSSASGTLAGLGFGASYAIRPNMALRVMFDWTRGKRDFFGAGQDLHSIRTTSLSVWYSF